MIFELLQSGAVVGIEEHKDSSYYNKKQIRIHHRKQNSGVSWDIKEWPERYIEHDGKRLIKNVQEGGSQLQEKQKNCTCRDCGFELVGW